ncbi:MAG: hypothetical protein CL441_02410 [Acidimicrobiaceae bacterium]|nr:hypothetical protein [Acidimicrobiaceae bacterium]
MAGDPGAEPPVARTLAVGVDEPGVEGVDPRLEDAVEERRHVVDEEVAEQGGRPLNHGRQRSAHSRDHTTPHHTPLSAG